MTRLQTRPAEPTFNYRVEPSGLLDAEDDDFSPEADRLEYARTQLAALQRHPVQRDGLPRRARRAYAAIVDPGGVLDGMGAKLRPGLTFSYSRRHLGEDTGVCEETAGRALADLEGAGVLTIVKRGEGAKAHVYRFAAAWLCEAEVENEWLGLGALAFVRHTTPLYMPKGNFCEGSVASCDGEDDAPPLGVERVDKTSTAGVCPTNANLVSADLFAYGQAREGVNPGTGAGEIGRETVNELKAAGGSLGVTELAQRIGCAMSSVYRMLPRLCARGVVLWERGRGRVTLLASSVESACRSRRRAGYLHALYAGEREAWRSEVQRQEEQKQRQEEDERHVREHKQRRRQALKRGEWPKVASAFDPLPSQPEAKPEPAANVVTPEVVPVAPVLAPEPKSVVAAPVAAPVAARVEQPPREIVLHDDPAEREESKRRFDQIAARHGVRPTEESAIERRRRRMGPPRKTCQHGTGSERPDGRCNVCAELRRLEAAA